MRARSLLALLLCFPSITHGDDLNQLRKEQGLRFFQPEPHMRLAKYHHDRDNRLLAFYILEFNRRHRFDRETFDTAFCQVFKTHEPCDHGQQTEAALLATLKEENASLDAMVQLADIYVHKRNWAAAREHLLRALELKPDDQDNLQTLASVMVAEGKQQEAEALIENFTAKHSDSRLAHSYRARRAMEKEPEKAKQLLQEAMRRYPEDGKFQFDFGVLLQNEGKLEEAEQQFERAAALEPKSAHIQGWTGRFYFRARPNQKKSLHYYLNAYFLDPHFYDTEFAESRISRMGVQLANETLARMRRDGATLPEIVKHPNPMVAGLALEAMGSAWDPSHTDSVLGLMAHDNEDVGAAAAALLRRHPDALPDARLWSLLEDADLRRRALAGLLATSRWKHYAIPIFEKWLASEEQVLRADAFQNLLEIGGDDVGRILTAYVDREQETRVKSRLGAVLQRAKLEHWALKLDAPPTHPNEKAAVDDLRTIALACTTFETLKKGKGFPATLAELFSAGEELLDAGLMSGAKGAYRFEYQASDPDADGILDRFHVSAIPRNQGAELRAFYTDESREVRVSGSSGRKLKSKN